MARLKVEAVNPPNPADPNDPIEVSRPFYEGYIKVVDALFQSDASFDEFVDADEDERSDMLQAYVGFLPTPRPGSYHHKVTHMTADDSVVDIDHGNCLIKTEKDKAKAPHRKRAKVTIALPPKKPPNFDYLQAYAEVIHDLYEGDATDKANAHKFLFGVMLLTRCR
jgi:hypothetical protein